MKMNGINLYYVGMCLLLGVSNFSLTKSQGRSRILSSKAGKEISHKDDLNDAPKSKSKSAKSNRKRTESFILIRKEETSYVDGISAMDMNGPNPRDVSNAFDSTFKTNSFGATDMLWAFGQLVNHDLSEVVPKPGDACNIPVAVNDPFLDESVEFIPMNRSTFVMDSTTDVAQQISMLSPFIDADNVYGTTRTRLNVIRADDSNVTGRLRTSGMNLLPKNTEGLFNKGHDSRTDFFLAGDVRANENLALLVSHTLWMREHNYWADRLRMLHPKLSGDDIFNEARLIVQSEMQKIIYDEFLPALLGDGAIPAYHGYDSKVDPHLENIVSSCAYRIGHTLVGPSLLVSYGNGTIDSISMEDTFFSPSKIEQAGGIDAFLRGMVKNVCQEADPFVIPAMRNQLFNNQFDLVAINIERARDHGIPDFNTIRKSLGFEKLSSFDDFLFSEKLASVYDDTDQIDCWIGMNSEPRIDGLMVGETQRAVLARNFANIRDGDPNFYKHSIHDEKLLDMIESTTFADIIRRNSDQPGSLDDVRDDVFFVPQGESLFH